MPPGPPASLAPGLPESGRAVQPILWAVIELWHRHESDLENWQDARDIVPVQSQEWADQVARLQMINTFQWHEEDRSRDPAADDSILAAVKRSIDASNSRRVSAVQAIDEQFFEQLRRAGCLVETASLHSESPGSILDRLTVLALKVYHLKEALATARKKPGPAEDPDLVSLYDRLRTVSEQMVDLTLCLDRFLEELRTGQIRFKLYGQIKVYRQAEGPDRG